MTPLKSALLVVCLLTGKMGSPSLDLSSPLRFLSVSVGEDVTLECNYQEGVAVRFYWYKQTLGQKPELLSKFYKHDKEGSLHGEFKNDPRFELETITGKNHLKIRHVQDSDSATYYCLSGYSYTFEFIGGVIILLKGSGLNVPAFIHQSGSETIQPGGSVTLNCSVHTGSCDGEQSVYWFKTSEETQPGLIYTHRGRNNQGERNQQTCIYNLLMENLDVSHAGTYRCAVVSCGHILFGSGTKLDFEEPGDHVVLVYFLSGALSVTSMLAVFLMFKASTLSKTTSCTCTEADHQTGAPAASGLSAAGEQDGDSLHYAALRKTRINRSSRPRDQTQRECVYSSVRQ